VRTSASPRRRANPCRAVIYIRMGRLDNDSHYSLAVQERLCRQAAEHLHDYFVRREPMSTSPLSKPTDPLRLRGAD